MRSIQTQWFAIKVKCAWAMFRTSKTKSWEKQTPIRGKIQYPVNEEEIKYWDKDSSECGFCIFVPCQRKTKSRWHLESRPKLWFLTSGFMILTQSHSQVQQPSKHTWEWPLATLWSEKRRPVPSFLSLAHSPAKWGIGGNTGRGADFRQRGVSTSKPELGVTKRTVNADS